MSAIKKDISLEMKNVWNKISKKEDMSLCLSQKPSCFPYSNFNLCKSKVDTVCGTTTTIVSG